jgi:hypothetical protein
MFISLVIFAAGMYNTTVEIQRVMRNCLWPLTFTLGIVFLKICCLKNQRVFMWAGFIICLTSQMWVFNNIAGKFTHFTHTMRQEEMPGGVLIQLKRWLMFVPFMLFGLVLDIQFSIQIKNYKPIAFVKLPYNNLKKIALLFSVGSLISSIATIFLSFLTFAKAIPHVNKQWVFYSFLIKAISWAPFIAWEYYDMVFESIYFDV